MLKPFAFRDHEKMREVLMDPQAPGPEAHYYMIRGGQDKKNITVWETGTVGGEYIKTYGHYHVGEIDETYWVLQGEGLIVLQKRKEESNVPKDDELEYFYIVRVKSGDSVFIPSGVGHLAINTGKTWFVTSDDSPVNFEEVDPVSLPGHADYEPVKRLRGFGYYIIEDPSTGSGQGEPKTVPNKNYINLPEPKWLTAQEYKELK